MLEFLCYSLVWIFAIYGFIEILKVIYFTFVKCPNLENSKIHIIIEVQNCENSIETFIRTFFGKMLDSTRAENSNVVVVDMNSTDNTKTILKRLEKEYNFELK